MPTITKRKILKVGRDGKSGLVTLPQGFVHWLRALTDEINPNLTIYGDSILILKPDDIPFDEASVYRLIDQVKELENKGDENK